MSDEFCVCDESLADDILRRRALGVCLIYADHLVHPLRFSVICRFNHQVHAVFFHPELTFVPGL